MCDILTTHNSDFARLNLIVSAKCETRREDILAECFKDEVG